MPEMEKHVENIKLAKFEAAIIKEWDFMTVSTFQRIKRYVWRKMLRSKTFALQQPFAHKSSKFFGTFKLSY